MTPWQQNAVAPGSDRHGAHEVHTLCGRPEQAALAAATRSRADVRAMAAEVPALVIHGDDDPRVPISTSLRLNELKPSLVTFEVFPGAGHLESWNIDRSRYMSLVKSFLAPLAS